MKVRYDLLFSNGIKEKVIQDATGEEHTEILQIISNSFKDNLNAVVTFGNGTNTGRLVRVSDLSQVQTEILERES